LEGSPYEIRTTAGRILVRHSDYWELFDQDLHPVGYQPIITGGPSGLALDPKRGLIYGPDGLGIVTAWNLSDAKPVYNLAFAFGSDFAKPVISRKDNVFLAVAVELPRDPHGHHKPTLSMLESRELEDPLKILDPMSKLAASKRIAHLYRDNTLLLPALHKDTLVLVCKNAYYLTDLKFSVKAAFQGEFIPHRLSLDEAGLIHLIVESKQKHFLWILDHTGRRLMDFPIAEEWGRIVSAPVIGYDHGVILVFEKRVVSVSPMGKRLWDKEYSDTVAGAAATPNGHVLVAAGRELLAIEPQGQRNVLARIPGESLRTSPVVTGPGTILIAGSKGLYQLAPKK
jgi:hypothetical protein